MKRRALFLSSLALSACLAPVPCRDAGPGTPSEVDAADAGGDGGSADAGAGDAGNTLDAGEGDAGVDGGLPRKRIFVTSSRFSGDLGGLDGGDQRCNLSAQLRGLGGRWIAWLSTGATATTAAVNAIDRVSDVGPWYLLNGQLAFANRGEMALAPRVPINVDDRGASIVSGLDNVWTGTRLGGAASLDDCNLWSSASSSYDGLIGHQTRNDLNWSEDTTYLCSNTFPLYCIEQ